MNEQDQFLSDLGTDQNRGVDVLDAPLYPEPAKTEEGEETKVETGEAKTEGEEDDGDFGGDDIKPRTRRERRLTRKLQEERESSIFLAGKLQAREEAKSDLNEESDYLKSLERIYGTETPEAQIATDLLKKALIGARDDAENRAYERVKTERQREIEEERQASSEIDNIVDDIEDTYDVTLTEPQEKAYLALLQKMSPKDAQGRVVALADPHAVWEQFQEKLQKKDTGTTRAKDLSSRSMTQSGASSESTLKDDAATRFLKENGII